MKRRDFIAASAATFLSMESLRHAVGRQISDQDRDSRTFDVIVLGVGSMGSATCEQLARRGVKVLGLEQFDIPHEQGSYHGQSRIIRKSYFEHPDYVPLLERAYENWKGLEERTGAKVYFKTGLVYYGKPDDALMRGVHVSSEKYHIPIDSMTADAASQKFPQFRVPSHYECIHEPDAGFVTPERAVLLFTEQALRSGAVIRTKEKVIEWKHSMGKVTVKTDRGAYEAKKLIITAGAWNPKLIPEMAGRLKVTRQVVGWMRPSRWKSVELGNFPCWILNDENTPGSFYGFPALPVGEFGGPVGLKLAHHFQGSVTDPDAVNRSVTAEDESKLKYALKKFLPGVYADTLTLKVCLYTNTPDENFVLDFLSGYDQNVAIAAGFSGHGFKFAPVVGEVMADLVVNKSTRLPIGFLSAGRFKSN